MPSNNAIYQGAQIKIDLNLMRFKRDADKDWMKLPPPKYLALTQIKMSQRGGIRSSFTLHTYNAFCVYLKAGNLNVLTYRGSRDKVEREASALSEFLQVKIVDLFPRDENGKIVDDDFGSSSSNILFIIAIALIALFLILGLLSA